MFVDFSSTYLELVRGDTLELPIPLNAGSREVPIYRGLEEGEVLEVSLALPNTPIEDALITKVLTVADDGETPVFRLAHDETNSLNIGKYYFTVRYTKDNFVQTLVNEKLFYITGSPAREGE